MLLLDDLIFVLVASLRLRPVRSGESPIRESAVVEIDGLILAVVKYPLQLIAEMRRRVRGSFGDSTVQSDGHVGIRKLKDAVLARLIHFSPSAADQIVDALVRLFCEIVPNRIDAARFRGVQRCVV